MKKYSFYLTLLGLVSQSLLTILPAQTEKATPANNRPIEDIRSDTWVGVDGLGRLMPTSAEVGTPKGDKKRTVGMFYITWHGDGLHNLPQPYAFDVSKALNEAPNVRLDANHPAWHNGGSYHWGEPELGYFLSKDEYVIRKDLSMLSDAGVDVLILDVTNAVLYWEEWEVLFNTMRKVKAEGNPIPKMCFWSFNGNAITVVQELYEKIYKQNRFRDLWFYWDGKPLLLYNARPTLDANGGGVANKNPNFDPNALTDVTNPHYLDPDYCNEYYTDYTQEVKNFFTLRNMWWGYYEWGGKRYVGTEDNWSFGYELNDPRVAQMHPDSLVSTHRGEREEAAVTPAQHPISITGKSWRRETLQPKLNDKDMPCPTFVPWLGKEVKDPTAYGIYFQDRWDEALKSDPSFLYLNDWNEWTAGKYTSGKSPAGTVPGPTTFLGRENPFYFVDQYNAEFNRTISPMKGGYTDNYYMQMIQNIRRYKGVRAIKPCIGFRPFHTNGEFDKWIAIDTLYFDTKGDIAHRDYPGYGGLHYTNHSGRNDIIYSKVAVDKESIHFYVETSDALTPSSDPNWMLLLIDADNDPQTGWHGYDFLVNKQVINQERTTLMHYNNRKKTWKKVAEIPYRYAQNQMELSLPRKMLKLDQQDHFVFDFKWSDNPNDLDDIISLCTHGDTAPNRRFNYRCIWREKDQ